MRQKVQISDFNYFLFDQTVKVESFLITNRDLLSKIPFLQELLEIYSTKNNIKNRFFISSAYYSFESCCLSLLPSALFVKIVLIPPDELLPFNIYSVSIWSLVILVSWVVFSITFTTIHSIICILSDKNKFIVYRDPDLEKLIFLQSIYDYLQSQAAAKDLEATFLQLLISPHHKTVLNTLFNVSDLKEREKLIAMNFPPELVKSLGEMGNQELMRLQEMNILKGNVKTLRILLNAENENEYISKWDARLSEIRDFNQKVENLIVSASRMTISDDVLQKLST